MRGKVSPYRVRLNTKARKRLEAVVRRRSPSHWLVLRAKIVLLSHKGLRNVQICAALTVDDQVARRWLKRFTEDGFDGLKDRKRSGRPEMISCSVWSKLATLVVQLPEKFGLPLARWSVRSLEAFVLDRYGWRISRSSISRFLREMALKPHRVRYWLNPSDPDFDEKAAEICKITCRRQRRPLC